MRDLLAHWLAFSCSRSLTFLWLKSLMYLLTQLICQSELNGLSHSDPSVLFFSTHDRIAVPLTACSSKLTDTWPLLCITHSSNHLFSHILSSTRILTRAMALCSTSCLVMGLGLSSRLMSQLVTSMLPRAWTVKQSLSMSCTQWLSTERQTAH